MAIECGGGCGSRECPYCKVPDRVITEGMTRLGQGAGYKEEPLPRKWKEALEYDWMGAVRASLISIMPETEMETAARYLRRARIALFLHRAIDAIRKGGLDGYGRQIEALLSGRGEPGDGTFEAAVEEATKETGKGEALNRRVLRVKAEYALTEAYRSLSAAP